MFFLVLDSSHSLVIWLVVVVNSIFSPCQPAQSDRLTAQVVLWLLEWTLHGNMVPVQISYLSRVVILWKPSENIREISEALENLLSCCHSYPEKEIDPPWGWGWRLWDVAQMLHRGQQPLVQNSMSLLILKLQRRSITPGWRLSLSHHGISASLL